MPGGHDLSRRAALSLGAAAPTVARATRERLWRMVTSWPKGRAGPGVSARRIAERINVMAGERLRVDLFGAGEIVPPLAVLDAVSTGTVELGHSASLYWQGKIPAASFFTTVPFGLGPVEHLAWVELRDGQVLWDELYRPFGVRAFLAGNTGPSMRGWFKRRLGSPNDLKSIVREACRAEYALGLADAHKRNAAALVEILGRSPVSLEAFPRSILDAARRATSDQIAVIAATSPIAQRIVESYAAAAQDLRAWAALAADMARAMARS